MKITLAALIPAVLAAGCMSPDSEHREYVKLFLNDPESAQFRSVEQSRRRALAWCGEVNAKNRMGGLAGFTRYVLVMPDADLKIKVKTEVEEAKMFAEFTTEGQSGFEGKWSIWCR
ncbi:hypothetical protein [Hydrogenophaga sp. BPS33]|uniref:hypothetical protein n=1 Tax=Hydrogenophaga sp. BPS33 TaxID=2651974 RepID=UPI00131F549A|nr:hypothetical protein [Hydrogenophaga sp. BPS33]QHE86506.1 hypothetical protein F9K07_17165 [Hydrogenophaga sp. BPS33]